MKIHLLSDLHLEFKDFEPPPTDADVVVLAGDIDVKLRGVEWAKAAFQKPVIMVLGNHDYWGGSLVNTVNKAIAAAQGSHVHVLHNSSLTLDGVKFLGATLWTDYYLGNQAPLAMAQAHSQMRDFQKIRNATYGRLSPRNLQAEHAQSLAFLRKELVDATKVPTVVVSHHAPSERSVASRYLARNDPLVASYASNLEALMGDARLFLHGHIHDNADYQVGATRVVCNPRGYVPLEPNENFNPSLVLTI